MNFLTLKFGDRYSADYVNKLYKGLKRNSSAPFDFIVIQKILKD